MSGSTAPTVELLEALLGIAIETAKQEASTLYGMVLVPGAPEDAFNELSTSRLLEIKANIVAFETLLNVIMSLCNDIVAASGMTAIVGAAFPITYALNTRQSSGVVSKHIVDYLVHLPFTDPSDKVLSALGSLPTDVLQVVANSVASLVQVPKLLSNGASTTDKDLKASAESLVKDLLAVIREAQNIKNAAINKNAANFKDSLFAGFMATLNSAEVANSFKKLNEVKKLIEDVTSTVSAFSSGSALDPWELAISQSTRAAGEIESVLRGAYDAVQIAYGALRGAVRKVETVQAGFTDAIAKAQANVAVLQDKPEWNVQIRQAEEAKTAAVNAANEAIKNATTEKLNLEQVVLQKETALLNAQAAVTVKKAAAIDADAAFVEATARQNAAEAAANPTKLKPVSGNAPRRLQEALAAANAALTAAGNASANAKIEVEKAEAAVLLAGDELDSARSAVDGKLTEVLTAIETKNAVVKASNEHIESVRKTIATARKELIIVQHPETYNADLERFTTAIDTARAAYDNKKKMLDANLKPLQAALVVSNDNFNFLEDAKVATDVYVSTVTSLKASAISPDSAEFKAESKRLEDLLKTANDDVAAANLDILAKQALLIKAQNAVIKAGTDLTTAEAAQTVVLADATSTLEAKNAAEIAVNNARIALADLQIAENNAENEVNDVVNLRIEATKRVTAAAQAINVHAGGLAYQIAEAYATYTKSLPNSITITRQAGAAAVPATLTPAVDFNFFTDAKREEADYVSATSKYQLTRAALKEDLVYHTAQLESQKLVNGGQLAVELGQITTAKEALDAFLANDASGMAYAALDGVLRDQAIYVKMAIDDQVRAKANLDAAIAVYNSYPSPRIIGAIKGIRKSVERIFPRQKN